MFSARVPRLSWTKDSSRNCRDGRHQVAADPCLLLSIPSHLLREVFRFLEPADVAKAAMACNSLRQVSRSESLWRDLLAAKLGHQANIVLPTYLPNASR